MPKGPNGEKRPADGIGNAVRIMQIATGEVEDTTPDDGDPMLTSKHRIRRHDRYPEQGQ